jgi:hypothetical protein
MCGRFFEAFHGHRSGSEGTQIMTTLPLAHFHPEVASLLKYISATPQLQSVLYDLDLLPEQLEEGSLDWRRMLQLTLWHRCVIQQEKP